LIIDQSGTIKFTGRQHLIAVPFFLHQLPVFCGFAMHTKIDFLQLMAQEPGIA